MSGNQGLEIKKSSYGVDSVTKYACLFVKACNSDIVSKREGMTESCRVHGLIVFDRSWVYEKKRIGWSIILTI